ncbi:MAG: TVP38/TMEM64 family protein, partial [Eubacterium sp.]
GVILFGAWKGFLYNYIGICIGSAAAFMIAKNCGEPVLQAVFGDKFGKKYHRWMHLKYQKFRKMFWIGIFAPVAPDDFLCYLAGTTEMSFTEFIICILLGKPLAIALYSLGLQEGMKLLQTLL